MSEGHSFAGSGEIGRALLSELPRLVPWTCASMLDGLDRNLGQSAAFFAADIPKERALIRAVAPNGCNTHVATIDLGFVGGPLGAEPRSAQVFARLKWGTGSGEALNAIVDVASGAQVSIPASTVEVSAFLAPAEDDTTPFDRVLVQTAIAWGTRAARSFPTLTRPRVLVANGASLIVPVPPFAYAVIVHCADPGFYAGGGGLVELLTGPRAGDAVILSADPAFGLFALFTEGLKLPGNCRAVRVTNTIGGDPGPDAFFTVFFALSL